MKKIIVAGFIMLLTIGIYISFAAQSADLDFSWTRGRTLDNFLKETTRVKPDEIMLTYDVSEVNTYKLTYNIENGQETRVTINKKNQSLDFTYQVMEWGTGNWSNDVTKAKYIDADFGEWDMNNQAFVAPGTLPTTNVTYTINRADAITGKIFLIKNQTVKFYWDVVKNKVFFVTDGLKKGNVHTFKVYAGNEENPRKTIDALKLLDFETAATHWVDDNGVVNKKYIIKTPEDIEQTGKIPGLELKIGRLSIWDNTSRTFVEIDDIDKENELNTTINIKQKQLTKATDIPPSVQYEMTLGDLANGTLPGRYDSETHKYVLDIVKDYPTANPENFIKWGELDYSNIYDSVTIIMNNKGNAKYSYDTEYKLSGNINYAATYINYTVERRNIDDTYLVIRPYDTKGIYDIYYTNSMITDPTSPSFKKWISHSKEAGINLLYIPVSVTRSDSGTKYYTFRIDYRMNEESSVVASQLLIYDANNDKIYNPPVPVLKQLENLVVVPPIFDGGSEPEKLDFTLVWENTDKILNMLGANKKIWFELQLNTLADDYIDEKLSENSQRYQVSKVIYMKKVGDEVKISVNSDADEDYKTIDVTKENFEVNLTFKDENGWIKYMTPKWQGEEGNLARPISGTPGEYETPVIQEYKNDFFNPFKSKVPGNYFLTMRAFYDEDVTNQINQLTISDFSVPISVYFDVKEQIIGIPTNIETKEITDSYFLLNWEDVNLDNYKTYMLDPINIEIDSKQYEIFISQSVNNLKGVISNSKLIGKTAIDGMSIPIANLKYMGLVPKEDPDNPTDIKMTSEDVTELRNSQVLAYKIDESQAVFSNLEPNTVYYVMIRTRLNMHKVINTDLLELERYSGTSSIKSVVVKQDAPLPTDDEKSPPVPHDFELVEMKTDNIVVKWTQPIVTSTQGETIGYDVVRIGDYPISEKHKRADTSISEIISDETYNEMRNFRIRNDALQVYDITSNAWVDASGDAITIDQDNGTYTLKDGLIAANQIYYYYVRTVRVTDGIDKLNSAWNTLSVTTIPILPVLNLKSVTSGYTYNEYNQTVIQFDAPVTDATKIPSIYEFGIAIKSQADNAYTETRDAGGYSDAQLAVLDTAGTGYRRYIYRIEGLKSGTKYSIKVRVYDKTKGALADGRYPSSIYCAKIETRTQFNQVDYDRENKYKQYVDYYKSKVADILKQSYWNTKFNEDLTIKYKAEKLNGEITTLGNNIYDLEAAEKLTKADEYVYIIPSSSFELLKEKKVSLKKTKDNTEVIIPPELINKEYTEKYAQVINRMKDVSRNIEDYYIRITFKYVKNTKSISGNEPVANELQLKVEIAEMMIEEDFLEHKILEKYNELVEVHKTKLLTKVEDKMGDILDDNKFSEILDEILQDFNKDMASQANSLVGIYDNTPSSITVAYNPITIKITGLAGNVRGYLYENSKWEEQELSKYLSQAFMRTKNISKYMLTSDSASESLIINSDNAGLILDVYSKYNLMGVIDTKHMQNPKNQVTKDVMRKIMQKVLSTNASNDYEQAKQEQELNKVLDFSTDVPTKEQTIYNLMNLYEKMTGAKISNMYIKDYTGLDYIKSASEKYKKSILVANEIGIINIKTFEAKQNVTYEELLMYLNVMGK